MVLSSLLIFLTSWIKNYIQASPRRARSIIANIQRNRIALFYFLDRKGTAKKRDSRANEKKLALEPRYLLEGRKIEILTSFLEEGTPHLNYFLENLEYRIICNDNSRREWKMGRRGSSREKHVGEKKMGEEKIPNHCSIERKFTHHSFASQRNNNTTFRYSSLVYGLCANLCFLIQKILKFPGFSTAHAYKYKTKRQEKKKEAETKKNAFFYQSPVYQPVN